MADANPTYFTYVRSEIAPLLKGLKPSRILEIGCGGGNTLEWLKQRWPEAETTGVDGYEPIRSELATRADHAIIHDLETPLPDLGAFDLILALDVLEHLREPAAVLRDLSGRVNPGGAVIVSVPNIANFQIIGGLLRRRFDYADAGILDRTHLRFFTEHSALQVMRDAGLNVTDGVITGLAGPKPRLMDYATLGLFRHFFVHQYVMRGERNGAAAGRPRWIVDRIPA